MDKITFLNELEHQLKRLPNDVIDDIMNQYENHFYKENEKGKTDREIILSLNKPKHIAKKKYAKYAVNDAEKEPDFSHLRRAVLATIGMSIVTLFFVVVPLIFLLLLIIISIFISLGMILAPIIVFLTQLYSGITQFSLSNYLFSFAYSGLGIMLFVIIVKVVCLLRIALLRYLKWNINFIKKGTFQS
ncbi:MULTISPECIES: HAAS signaling domain-containing protein [Staphylococcus]|uniref:DUF1700 domain-containing protein n=2 Tax=Staphylococcus agnetis TaxID=985762 RepID=A0ABD7TW50_9STAP|nr:MULTISPECIES: DUF1700 domain-containing protein [Staphylococcus]MBY7664603.1 DUF1700 domain-containing protein [Staphylococcus agnetis]MCO4326322.1 DUF1700 domain-containing protein [Staphylococcus agnetis]MCO4357155.1 DUF1700 domain-containing protein [Staphylococcus agnetis]MCO4362064.1 DUF1700 domain-containing protein [Staphylococcus agnetis]MCO4369465.1 DUF1700 domain-containing protein [Staphylococcus agnetis]